MQKRITRAVELVTAIVIILAVILGLSGCAHHWQDHGRKVANQIDDSYLTRAPR